MNSALKASVQAIPERTLYVVTGGVAAAGAAVPLMVIAIARPYLGDVVGYALAPLVLAAVAWAIAAVLRLKMVGFLPSQAEGLIPRRLAPWIRSWLLVRLGLLGSGLLLICAGVVAALAHGPVGWVIEAFVYVVWFRVFLDLVFGATFNAGVISTRK